MKKIIEGKQYNDKAVELKDQGLFKHIKAKEKIGTDRKKERKRNGPPFDHKFNFKVLLCAAVTICGNQQGWIQLKGLRS